MKMIGVQKIGDATISVREDLAHRVVLCKTCKGFGEVTKTLYRSGIFERYEHIYRHVTCPTCKGRSITYKP